MLRVLLLGLALLIVNRYLSLTRLRLPAVSEVRRLVIDSDCRKATWRL